MKYPANLYFTLLILLTGCDNFNLTPDIAINFQDPTNVTETGFQIGWSINTTDYQELTFILAKDPDFIHIVDTKSFKGNSTNNATFRSLQGAATYYYRISLVRAPGSIYISKTKSIELPFQQEFVSFPTSDVATLKGSLYYRGALNGKRPAIILMHEFGIFVNGWINSEILKLLVAEGYICMVFYNRGHGQSSGIDDLQDLINDPSYLANDLRGAQVFIRQNERVMADSIALMGASMGASMAISGNGNEFVRTSVALSPSTLHTGYMYPGVPLSSILYIAGDQDIVSVGSETVDFPAQAVKLFGLTNNPKKLMIIEKSSAHGTELLETKGVNEAILQWITQQMPVVKVSESR